MVLKKIMALVAAAMLMLCLSGCPDKPQPLTDLIHEAAKPGMEVFWNPHCWNPSTKCWGAWDVRPEVKGVE